MRIQPTRAEWEWLRLGVYLTMIVAIAQPLPTRGQTVVERILSELDAYNNAYFDQPGSGGPDGIRIVGRVLPGGELRLFQTNVPVDETWERFDEVSERGFGQPNQPGDDPGRIPADVLVRPLNEIPTTIHHEAALVNPVGFEVFWLWNQEFNRAMADINDLISNANDPLSLTQLVGDRLAILNDQFYNLPGTGGPDGIRCVAMMGRDRELAVFTTNVPVNDTFGLFEEIWNSSGELPVNPGPTARRIGRDETLEFVGPSVDQTRVGLVSLLGAGIDQDVARASREAAVAMLQRIADIPIGNVVSIGGQSADGNGSVELSIAGLSGTYETSPDATPSETVDEFLQFLGSFEVDGQSLITHRRSSHDPNTILFFGNLPGPMFDQLRIEFVQSDSSQWIYHFALEDLSPVNFHPADTNKDFRVVIDEVTDLGAKWRRGTFGDIDAVTRAGFLWRSGEQYGYAPDNEGQLQFVPKPDDAPRDVVPVDYLIGDLGLEISEIEIVEKSLAGSVFNLYSSEGRHRGRIEFGGDVRETEEWMITTARSSYQGEIGASVVAEIESWMPRNPDPEQQYVPTVLRYTSEGQTLEVSYDLIVPRGNMDDAYIEGILLTVNQELRLEMSAEELWAPDASQRFSNFAREGGAAFYFDAPGMRLLTIAGVSPVIYPHTPTGIYHTSNPVKEEHDGSVGPIPEHSFWGCVAACGTHAACYFAGQIPPPCWVACAICGWCAGEAIWGAF